MASGLARILALQWRYARRGRLVKAFLGFRAIAERVQARLAPRGRGRRECNLCGWRGPAFLSAYYDDAFRPGVFCPQCGSAERHRTLRLLMGIEFGAFFGERRRRVLDVAPIVRGRELFPAPVDYVSFDLASPLARVRGDLCRAPFADASFDFVLCYHVLEHIPGETAALREVLRLLRPGGAAILQVPWDPGLAATEEYAAPRPEEEGHVRRYGRDVEERWRRAGFLTDFREIPIAGPLRRRHGLERGVTMMVRTAAAACPAAEA